MSELRFAFRSLRRTPGFTTAAVLTLALGIGATTAIVSTVDAVLLRPLPYDDPDRLVMVWEEASAAGFPRKGVSPDPHEAVWLPGDAAASGFPWYSITIVSECTTSGPRVRTTAPSKIALFS